MPDAKPKTAGEALDAWRESSVDVATFDAELREIGRRVHARGPILRDPTASPPASMLLYLKPEDFDFPPGWQKERSSESTTHVARLTGGSLCDQANIADTLIVPSSRLPQSVTCAECIARFLSDHAVRSGNQRTWCEIATDTLVDTQRKTTWLEVTCRACLNHAPYPYSKTK